MNNDFSETSILHISIKLVNRDQYLDGLVQERHSYVFLSLTHPSVPVFYLRINLFYSMNSNKWTGKSQVQCKNRLLHCLHITVTHLLHSPINTSFTQWPHTFSYTNYIYMPMPCINSLYQVPKTQPTLWNWISFNSSCLSDAYMRQ